MSNNFHKTAVLTKNYYEILIFTPNESIAKKLTELHAAKCARTTF